MKETCKTVSERKTVSSDPNTTSYTVYIQPDGAVLLNDPNAGQRHISNPVEGFPRKAEFTAMQQQIKSGKAVEPEVNAANAAMRVAGGIVAVPVLFALCGGTFFLLCPL